ncbi:MAG: M48 family metallopeptidase [Saprospiraceae bacterium]|nr:M48 family metallopeptidase [Saprospiraceae bacterium]
MQYVVVLADHPHPTEFYALMDMVTPDWRKLKRRLEERMA